VIARIMCALLGHYFHTCGPTFLVSLPARCCRCGKLVE